MVCTKCGTIAPTCRAANQSRGEESTRAIIKPPTMKPLAARANATKIIDQPGAPANHVPSAPPTAPVDAHDKAWPQANLMVLFPAAGRLERHRLDRFVEAPGCHPAIVGRAAVVGEGSPWPAIGASGDRPAHNRPACYSCGKAEARRGEPMSNHKFKIGQFVSYRPPRLGPGAGVYQIAQFMPSASVVILTLVSHGRL